MALKVSLMRDFVCAIYAEKCGKDDVMNRSVTDIGLFKAEKYIDNVKFAHFFG